ncbi:cell division protein FtsQ/DivIB [Lacticaseibacillus zhaodongensis]|uniref:cell division protein FtsQ/DivIB n=1 Tax=Lacticaseibacillus zhaodongensis TaxID=2668065 RepID=UPI0012D2AA2E|nr:cell division protein FtsQ/DivIB [Lacticaseibacillus zhaodongensis]
MARKKNPDVNPRASFDNYAKQLHGSEQPPKNPKKIQQELPKVQKIRQRRTIRNLILILTPLLVVGALCVYMGTSMSKVSNVSVHGTDLIINQDVIDASGLNDKSYVPQLLLNRKRVARQIKRRVPAAQEVTIKMTSMRDVAINVHEYSATGYLDEQDGYHVILSTGVIMKAETDHPKQGLPVFRGFTKVRELRKMIKLVNQFPVAIRRDVSEITATNGDANPYQITISMNDGNEVIADRRTVVKKIKYYPSIVAQVKGQGTVDLEVGAFFTPKASK